LYEYHLQNPKPHQSLLNAIFVPSGDQAGVGSTLAPHVLGSADIAPLVKFITMIRGIPELVASSTSSVKAILVPSGDHAGFFGIAP
jgi:hypothetical protein